MGTRHLIAVKTDGQYKVAQYGQWDGHPGGQGSTVLKTLRDADQGLLRDKARAARFGSTSEIKERWTECGADPESDMVGMDVAERFAKRFPQLSRDCGADVLSILAAARPGLILQDRLGFAADSLFCEWGYVVDFDLGTFEVYKGFNESPLGEAERFAHMAAEREDQQYHPIKLVRSYRLDSLPTHDAFIDDLREPDEEE